MVNRYNAAGTVSIAADTAISTLLRVGDACPGRKEDTAEGENEYAEYP